jgi:hypothetical protein
MGKVEGKGCSPEGQNPFSNEYRQQEEVVGVDEGAVGSEEKVERIVQGLNIAVRGLGYSRLSFLPVLVHTVT